MLLAALVLAGTSRALDPSVFGRFRTWPITAVQERECKQRMNTFAYIGSVRDKPVVRCVYQTDISENKFLTRGVADNASSITPEADQF